MKENEENTCPQCGSTIPSEAPGGLCPACVLERAATIPSPIATGGIRKAPPSPGDIALHFPDLEIEELLGAGGMGAVYRARQPQLDRTVAIKILSEELAEDPSFIERFNREARVLAKLSHPNIVGVHDFGTAGPYCFLTMEYVDGVNLRQALRTGGFSPAEALALVQEICSALQFAHSEGILHRDIKPENVLIDSKGRVKIADFGIAKMVGQNDSNDVTLTMEGSILGSPQYMAPEQIETPGDVDQRADIYSLGVVLYEMLTGELPIGRFALPSEKAQLDARIDDIVMRTLEKERELRYQTVGDVKTSVEAIDDPTMPSEKEFITDQILGISKITFWISIIFLAWLILEAISGIFGDVDDSLETSDRLPYLVGAAILMSMISGVLAVVHKIRTGEINTTLDGGKKLRGNVTTPAPTPARKPEPIQQDQVSARFSTASAILTGISLLLGVATLILVLPMMSWLKSSDPGWDDSSVAEVAVNYKYIIIRTLIVGLALLAVGVPALLGWGFGVKALAEIRRSGGQKLGLGASIFSSVAWPILLMAPLGSLFLASPGGGAGGLGALEVIFILVVSQIVVAMVFVRSLRRWAGGVLGDGGERIHPGLGRPFFVALGALILVPVLINTLTRFSSSPNQAGSVAGDRSGPGDPPMVSNSGVGNEPSRELESSNRTNELIPLDVDLTLAPGLIATVELIRTDAVGNVEVIEDHQGFVIAADDKEWKGSLGLSARRFNPGDGELGGWWEMMSSFRPQSRNTEWIGDAPVLDFDLDAEWVWTGGRDAKLGFPIPGEGSVKLASREDLSQTLSLRVVVRPRVIPGIPAIVLAQVKLENAVVGRGGEIEWIRFLMEQLEQASDPGTSFAPEVPEPEWREGKPESHVNLTIEPGLVAKISLSAPGPDGESKTLHKGYIVSSDLEPWEGKIRLGSLAGSSKIQWRIEGPYQKIATELEPGYEWKVRPMATNSHVEKPSGPTVKAIAAGTLMSSEGTSAVTFVVLPITRKNAKADLPEIMPFHVMGMGEDPDWIGDVKRAFEYSAEP